MDFAARVAVFCADVFPAATAVVAENERDW